MLKKKFIWTFEGKDILPETKIRPYCRPAFPYSTVADLNGGRFLSHSGELSASGDLMEMEVPLGYFRLSQPYGEVFETWILHDVSVRLVESPSEWIITYKSADYFAGNKH